LKINVNQLPTLLLTATITPPQGATHLVRTDPKIRLKDYERALRFYLKFIGFTFGRIVFVDNSGSDIASLQQIVDEENQSDSVELLSFRGLDYPVGRGRGYGEFLLIDFAMENSLQIAKNPEADVWKCTGRYIVRNIAQLVASKPSGVSLYCHFRNWPKELCDMSLICWNDLGYQTYIAKCAKFVRNDLIPGIHTVEESLFRKHIETQTTPSAIIKKRFATTPLIEGHRGWDNSKYSSNHSPKIWLRRVASIVAPWYWI
jgi:hypothetical protein